MNNYNNVLLEEYFSLREEQLDIGMRFHSDYVESYPKGNGMYQSVHTDVDTRSNGGGGGGNDDDFCGCAFACLACGGVYIGITNLPEILKCCCGACC